jgi:hypothetical protein
MLRNGIPKVRFVCSMVQNSDHFSPLRNGWERNFLLAALLLEGELYLEAGVAPHHEEEAGVDVLQVRLVAPRHADHLSEC